MAEAAQAKNWGWLPELSMTSSVGLLLIAFTNYGAYTAAPWAAPLFWLGLLVLLLPCVYRLSSAQAARRERIALVILLVASLFSVKLIHSPFTFTFADEFVHAYNAQAVLDSNHLFNSNSFLRITTFYPGLATVTAALADMTGLPVMAAAVMVIAAARVILALAMFLLFEQLSGSARVAGLGVALYTAQSNFLYWSAQFAYESLSFPLVVTALYLAARSQSSRGRGRYWGYTSLALLVIAVTTVTHHLSSYALALFLLSWSLLEFTQPHIRLADILAALASGISKSSGRHTARLGRFRSLLTRDVRADQQEGSAWRRAPVLLAVFGAVTAVAWLLLVAKPTVGYLQPVLRQAVLSLIQVLTGEQASRQLFVSNSGYVAPLWERVTGIAAVLLCAGGLPFGLYQIWRRYSRSAVIFLLACAAAAYFFILGFRLTGAGWETANRASSYLFFGLALVLSIAAVQLWLANVRGRMGRLALAVYVAIVFTGGVIAGWPEQQRLAMPYMVNAGSQLVLPEGETAAAWVSNELPPGAFVADEANGRLLLARAGRPVYAGGHPFVAELLTYPELDRWQLQAIQDFDMNYVVVDRRHSSWNNMVGYFFQPTQHPSERLAQWLKPQQYQKYSRQPNVDRLFDSGNIAIYGIGALRHAPPAD